MSGTFAAEINWWNKRASEFESKRASLQPLSYSYASQAYSARGNGNGAAALDSMRLSIYRQGAADRRAVEQEYSRKVYKKPLTEAQKKKEDKEKEKAAQLARYQNAGKLESSEDVTDLMGDVDRLEDKIRGVGGEITSTLVGGFSRAINLLSRSTWAVQSVRAQEIENAKEGDGNISLAEHIGIAVKPFFTFSPAITAGAMVGNEKAASLLDAGVDGLSGRSQIWGSENLKAEYPNWTKAHTTATAVAGFASDVASDPLTYLTMGSGTAAKTVGMGAARVTGQKALARSLAEQTLWTRTGRAAGKEAVELSIRTGKTAKQAKKVKSTGKASTKASKKVKKSPTAVALENKGKADAALAKATVEFNNATTLAMADELKGISDIVRYYAKHPLKAMGSYSQGLRQGSIKELNKAAKVQQGKILTKFVDEMTGPATALADKRLGMLNLSMRSWHASHTGKSIKTGLIHTFTVADDYDTFIKEFAKTVYSVPEVTEMTRKAVRGRYSVLAQLKAHQYGVINMITKSDIQFVADPLKPWVDNVLDITSPVARAKTEAIVAKLDPVQAESLEFDVAKALDAIMNDAARRKELLPEFYRGRAPELTAMDDINGLSEGQIAARENFRRIATDKLNEAGIALDDLGNVENTTGTIAGGTKTTGKTFSPQYTEAYNRKLAEAISESMEQAVRNVAMHDLMNDPEIIVSSWVDAAHEIINQISADTHVQVMEFLRFKHGMSMPSMSLPRAYMDDLVTSGRVWEDVAEPATAAKHYAGYLKHRIEQALGKLEGDPRVYASRTVMDDGDIALGNDYFQVLDSLDDATRRGNVTDHNKIELMEALERLQINGAQLEELTHAIYTGEGSVRPGIDTYTMLDHIVFGSATQELGIGTSKIGRANFASDAINTGGIPPYSQEILQDISTVRRMEQEAVSNYKRFDKTGYPEGMVPKTEAEVRDVFNKMLKGLVEEDLRFLDDGAGGIDPSKALGSLGSQLDLLHSTTEYRAFGIPWRRQMASNIWGMPVEKIDGTFKPGSWSSASLMADLNEAVSVGILDKTVRLKMTPDQIADWLATKAKNNPDVEALLRQSDLQGVRGGNVGAARAGLAGDDSSAKVAKEMADSNLPPNNTEEAIAASKADDARDSMVEAVDGALVRARKTAETKAESDGKVLAPKEMKQNEGSAKLIDADLANNAHPQNPANQAVENYWRNQPGGHAAPDMSTEQIKAVQNFIDETFGEVDSLTLSKLMEGLRSDQIASIVFYDQKLQELMGQFELVNSMQFRVAGMPVGSVALRNNPMHTNAGVLAMNQDLPKHLKARAKVDANGSPMRATAHKWLTRQTSSLDEGMRQMMTKFSGESTWILRGVMDQVKMTYRSFKNKAELKTATRDYFTRGAKIDDRLIESEKRFNGVHKRVMEHATDFTGKDLGYDSNFVRGSVNSILSALPGGYRVDKAATKEFVSHQAIFSRDWWLDLSEHLHNVGGPTANHPLAGDNIKNIDMGKLEFGFQHAAEKLRVRNNTSQVMIETFSTPFSPAVVEAINAQPGIAGSRNEFKNVAEVLGVGRVPEELQNQYVIAHVGEEMKKVLNFVDESMDLRKNRLNFSYMRDINNMWKSGVTIFSFKYHTGNIMSDGFMSLIDGVRPESYKKAATALFTDPDNVDLFTDPNYIKGVREIFSKAADSPDDLKVMEDTLKYIQSKGVNGTVSTLNVLGKPVVISSSEYNHRFRGYGLDQNNVTGNLSRSTENMSSPLAGTFSRYADVVQDSSAKREDYFRMAHFIHATEQEARVPGRSLDDIFLAARDRVMTWHFDYQNVTEFERNKIAPLAPFYKWTRNIVPLSLSVFFTNPKAYTIPRSLNRTMGEIFFPTAEDAGNDIPLEAIIPSWMTEQGSVPIEIYLDEEGNKHARYAILNLPFDQQMVKWFSPFTANMVDPEYNLLDKTVSGPGSALASSAASLAHPLVKTGLAAATGKVPWASGPMDVENWWDPLTNMLVSGTGAFGEIATAKMKKEPFTVPAMMSAVELVRDQKTTEGNIKGELLRREDRAQAILKKANAAWLAKQYPGLDPGSDLAKEVIHDHNVDLGILER